MEVSRRVDTFPGLSAREQWRLALAAWEHTPTISSVSTALGCGQGRAQSMLDVGIPELGLPPVRVQAELRARELAMSERAVERVEGNAAARLLERRVSMAREAEARAKEIAGDARDQKEAEARMVRMNRQGAIALASINARLLRGAIDLADGIERDLAHSAGSLKERMAYLRTMAQIVQRTAETSAKCVQMERLLLGEPTSIIGTIGTSDEMTAEEAEQYIALATRAVRRRARRRTVIDATVVDTDGVSEPG